MSFADRWRIAADIADRFHSHLDGLVVDEDIWVTPADYATLLALHDTFEGAAVYVFPRKDEHAVAVTVSGKHRGLPAWAQIEVREPADLDLIRSFPESSRELLVALAGDPVAPGPSLAERRDAVRAEVSGG